MDALLGLTFYLDFLRYTLPELLDDITLLEKYLTEHGNKIEP